MPSNTKSISPQRHVRCVYCSAAIAAESFTYTSAAKRLVIASCAGCRRRMTLPTATWLRWSV
jgi:hypothetical protein